MTAASSTAPDDSGWPVSGRLCAARSLSVVGKNPNRRIARSVFAALADPAGVIAHRAGALERVQLLL